MLQKYLRENVSMVLKVYISDNQRIKYKVSNIKQITTLDKENWIIFNFVKNEHFSIIILSINCVMYQSFNLGDSWIPSSQILDICFYSFYDYFIKMNLLIIEKFGNNNRKSIYRTYLVSINCGKLWTAPFNKKMKLISHDIENTRYKMFFAFNDNTMFMLANGARSWVNIENKKLNMLKVNIEIFKIHIRPQRKCIIISLLNNTNLDRIEINIS
ncbi:hypothetical protein A3Q56_02201 [Intoshia linei]|uniref:Sortilin N-terminal domain-containing protein n=1 Tax=Intoshia linei TaxID=1819745 RepID=A0A177B728_9BILA|nr:hypothetical protein A3Q56_02201 [Intoshia linei]